jgi:outer membrane protein assembly factor BamA
VQKIQVRRLTLALVLVVASAGSLFAQDMRIDERPEGGQSLLNAAPRPNAGLLTEPRLLTSAINTAFDSFGETGTPKNGYYTELSNMITGSGFVSVGPGYRHDVFGKTAFVDLSGALSWRLYTMMQGRFEMPSLANDHMTIGAQTMWQDQTQNAYFGVGSASLSINEAQYRMQSVDSVGYLLVRPVPSLTVGAEFGFLRRPDILSPGGTFKQALPTIEQQFPGDPGVSTAFQPNYLHGEASIVSDTRDHRSRPTSGGVYRAALVTFDDQSTGTFSFRQYEAEAARFIQLRDTDWVIALHGWVVATDVSPGQDVPFYLQPSLGGHNSLRSYPDYRFHDRNLALVNAESRWGLFTHVDVAAFVDAGNVSARFQDLDLAKTSYGGGVRLHTDRTTFARLDVAYGAEGWRFVFRTSDPLRLSRLSRRVAAVPFVP